MGALRNDAGTGPLVGQPPGNRRRQVGTGYKRMEVEGSRAPAVPTSKLSTYWETFLFQYTGLNTKRERKLPGLLKCTAHATLLWWEDCVKGARVGLGRPSDCQNIITNPPNYCSALISSLQRMLLCFCCFFFFLFF